MEIVRPTNHHKSMHIALPTVLKKLLHAAAIDGACSAPPEKGGRGVDVWRICDGIPNTAGVKREVVGPLLPEEGMDTRAPPKRLQRCKRYQSIVSASCTLAQRHNRCAIPCLC